MMKFLILPFLFFAQILFSQNCDSLYLLSLKAFDKQQYKESIELVNKSIQICPTKTDFHVHAAKCNYQIKNYEATLSHVNSAIKLDDKCVPAYALKAQMMLDAEMYQQAIVNYENIIALIPQVDSTTVLYRVNLSTAYMNTNQFQKAYDIIKTVYSIDSSNIELITNLSVCCINLDKETEAEYYLQKCLTINPTFTAGLINMGFYLIEKQEYQKAIEYLNKVLAIQPAEAYALNNRGFAYYKLKNNDKALEDISQSIAADPSNSYAYKNRALVYFQTGLTAESCQDLQKAIDLGYTQMYGDEVLILQKEACPKK